MKRIASNLGKFVLLIFAGVLLIPVFLSAQNLEFMSSYALPDGAYGITLVNNLAYIANDINGIQILDITDPYNPSGVGSYDTPGFTRNLVVSANYAYVADGEGIVILDISNPAAPGFVGSRALGGTALTVALSGNYLYVANGYNGMMVIDVSNPADPTTAGFYSSFGYLMGVCVQGNYAFVTANYTEPDYGQLIVLDISNPANPTWMGDVNINYAGAYGVSISGDYAFVGAFTYGMRIFDISYPPSPAISSAYDTPGSCKHIFSVGNYAFAADGLSGIEMFDITDRNYPILLDSVDTPGNAYDVIAAGEYVYIADESSMEIYKITQAQPPTCSYVTGDINGSNTLNGLDVTYGVNYFRGGAEPPYTCECTPGNIWFVAGDVNASCSFNGLDITWMVNYFRGAEPPMSCPDCPSARR